MVLEDYRQEESIERDFQNHRMYKNHKNCKYYYIDEALREIIISNSINKGKLSLLTKI